MKKSVSIVIPTFNRANYLKQCIDSALAQTYPCEIIVCDHGSADRTPSVARSYGTAITYIRREKDLGVHFCWLDAVLHASSDLIHINYDDDWIESSYIEKCVRLFSDQIGLVYSNAKVFEEKENRYSEALFPSLGKTGIYSSRRVKEFGMRGLISPGAIILRKNIILDNLFCGKVPFSRYEYRGVGPDLLFSLMSTLQYKEVGYVDECLAIFRSHENSITIDALRDREKVHKLTRAYDEARTFYLMTEFVNRTGFDRFLYLCLRVRKRLGLI